MFSGHVKKLFLFLCIVFYNNLASSKINQSYTKNNAPVVNHQITNQEKETAGNKDIDSISLTAKRIIFKSFLKSVWKMAETRDQTNNYAKIKYKLGEAISDLIIDETLQSKNQNKIQKISESLAPIIISECILYQHNNSLEEKYPAKFNKQNSNDLLNKISKKLIFKIVQSNFFLEKENKYYNQIKYLTMPLAFLDNKNPLAFLDNKNQSRSLQTGTKNVIKETVQTVIASKQINLGKTLNKRHRKKAISKIVNIIIEPFIDNLFD